MIEFSEIDKELINSAYQDMLSNSLRPLKEDEIAVINKAFQLASEAHKGTRRKSGEPYIMHPIAVAKIVVNEIGLGYVSAAAALLHDVVEDTPYTVEDIEGMFGKIIANMVSGLTKLDSILDQSESIQAENFKKMMLAMADDIRIILIKLADRLHNMRTLGSMAPHKQEKIAGETIYLYAPLAHRLGLYNIKTELEDLTLKYQFPKVYQEIKDKIAATEIDRNAFIAQFNEPIIKKLQDSGISFEISGRVKSIYSIWKKMQMKKIPFEEIYDLFAVRIVFKPTNDTSEKTQSWFIYSIITDIYKPNYDRIRDWINNPKANGYEALHITVMGPRGQWVETQIRSERMNETAERGYAAHWRYKEGEEVDESNADIIRDQELDKFLSHIREMLSNTEQNSVEFLDQLKLNLFSSVITAFTPKGKIISLPKGSAAIDFAYEIHTAIGNKAIGAKVNHKLVPLSYKLNNGDQIEILTADNQKPQQDWLIFATTARAQNQIKTAIKSEVKAHFQKGKQAVEDAIREAGWFPNAILYKRLSLAYNVNNKEELFSKVGAGLLSTSEVEKVVKKIKGRNRLLKYWELQLLPRPKRRSAPESPASNLPEQESKPKNTIDKRSFLLKEGSDLSTLSYKIAKCCNPIPGDRVIGFVDYNNEVLIHKKECPVAIKEAAQHGDQLVSVKWTEHKILSFLAGVKLMSIDRLGLL
ncbi:MAG: RelA/SpoT family protein, partial [Prevotellaceae bacterium]|nr:RelA/SpoT family protein [Prevotellaceae bacterium]